MTTLAAHELTEGARILSPVSREVFVVLAVSSDAQHVTARLTRATDMGTHETVTVGSCDRFEMAA